MKTTILAFLVLLTWIPILQGVETQDDKEMKALFEFPVLELRAKAEKGNAQD